MMKTYLLVIFFAFAVTPSIAEENGIGTTLASPDADKMLRAIKAQLPPAPEGFRWHLHKNAVFLQPENWFSHLKNSVSNGISAATFATSPVEFSETKQFEMGLTVTIFSKSKQAQGLEARKAVLVYLKPFLNAHKKEEILKLDQSTRGDFERTIFRYKDSPPGLTPIIVHKFILANDITDSFHVFTFESPEANWDENWAKFGTPILTKINVFPNIPSDY